MLGAFDQCSIDFEASIPRMSEVEIPIVPRPPILKRPKRLKGEEQVVILGVTLRMTITSDGLEGMSLDVISQCKVEGDFDVKRITISRRLRYGSTGTHYAAQLRIY